MSNAASKRFWYLGFLLLLILISAVGCAQTPVVTPAPAPTRDPLDEQLFIQQLQAINPDAVPIYKLATTALDSGDYATAKSSYEQITRMAPAFSTAYRRLGYIEMNNNDLEGAVELYRQALALEPNAYNQSSLALAIFYSSDKPAARQEAFDLASAAVAQLPDDINANMVLLLAASSLGKVDIARLADSILLKKDPANPLGHYFAGLLAAEDGKWEQAETELLYANALGLDAELVQSTLDLGIARNALLMRFLRWGAVALGIWILGLGLLYLVGNILSRATIRSLKSMEPTVGAGLRPAERKIRSFYRTVILILSLYFYISIPFVVLLLLLFVGGLIYLFLRIGTIPIQITLILIAMLFVSLFAILRTIFLRRKEVQPGRLVNRSDVPELWSLVEQVARKMDTRPVDEIYVTPYTGVLVNERGSIVKKLRGSGKRVLILGMGVLPCLNQGQFAAILAHEYGHFYNRDTAGGNLAHQVQASLDQMAFSLSRGRAAHGLNPVWWFIVAYQRIFLRVALGASRLQEVLADRQAAMAYGRTNSVEGLQKFVRQTINFQMQANFELRKSFELNRPIRNIHQLPVQEELLGESEKAFDEIMKRKTGPYDSHPSLSDRIELINRMRIPYGIDQENSASVLDLFPNPSELQADLTVELMKSVRRKS